MAARVASTQVGAFAQEVYGRCQVCAGVKTPANKTVVVARGPHLNVRLCEPCLDQFVAVARSNQEES